MKVSIYIESEIMLTLLEENIEGIDDEKLLKNWFLQNYYNTCNVRVRATYKDKDLFFVKIAPQSEILPSQRKITITSTTIYLY